MSDSDRFQSIRDHAASHSDRFHQLNEGSKYVDERLLFLMDAYHTVFRIRCSSGKNVYEYGCFGTKRKALKYLPRGPCEVVEVRPSFEMLEELNKPPPPPHSPYY